MLVVTFITPRSKTITKHYPASNFPYETIIKLVQSGVTVTINSASNDLAENTQAQRILAYGTKVNCKDLWDEQSILASDEVSIPDIIGRLHK